MAGSEDTSSADGVGVSSVILFGGAVQLAVVTVDHGPDGIAEIAQQVPAVRHLDRLRCALADPVGVGAGTVARDDLDPGMLTKPLRQCLSLTIRQQVRRSTTSLRLRSTRMVP